MSGRTFLFFYKVISYLQTTCPHFCIRIYRTGRLHENEKGARVFPVNNFFYKGQNIYCNLLFHHFEGFHRL